MKFKEQFENIYPDNFLSDYLSFKGISDTEEYLNPTGKHLEPPKGYFNMKVASECLEKYQGKDFMILVDCDVDGFCSSAIMIDFCVNYLNMNSHIIFHKDKKHGLGSKDIMEQIKSEPYDLLIIPDAGSNDTEQCKELVEKNIIKDILILDHHNIDRENPYAIIINNQHKDNDGIENIHLSGAGVTYKFIQYFCEYMDYETPYYADLVAVSLVSDICDLSNQENRVFIRFGLYNLVNECLNELFRGLSQSEELIIHNVAWDIAPKINALCRTDKQELKERLITALSNLEKGFDYEKLIKDLVSNHAEMNRIAQTTAKKYDYLMASKDKVVIIQDNECPRSITGLVASKVAEKLNKPVLLVHEDKSGERLSGSCRSPQPISQILNDSGLFIFNQGHDAAFGTEFEKKNLEKIINFGNTLDFSEETVYNVIKSYNAKDLIPPPLFKIGEEYKHLWGKGIEYPIFGIKGIKINGKLIKRLGKKKTTIKFRYNGYDFIKFSISHAEQEEKLFVGEDKDMLWTITGRLMLNEWNGRVTKQIQMEEIDVIDLENDWRSVF